MSLSTTEHNYKIAKSLYQDISDDFYEIENNKNSEDDNFLIDQTLEDIKKLNRRVSRINIEDIEGEYDEKVVDTIKSNLDTFKESSYYIERALMSMKLFDKLHPVLNTYIKNVEWENIADSEEEATTKFGRYITSDNVYQDYKTIINNLIKGTMSPNSFKKLFNTVSSRLAKPKPKPSSKQRNAIPPQMWPKDKQKDYNNMIDKRKKAAEKISNDENIKESFISLVNYKVLNESLAFYCGTCGERAEHEEIEDNPRMKCSNCGDCDWEEEY